jgi:hypothetical protein
MAVLDGVRPRASPETDDDLDRPGMRRDVKR